MSNVVVAPGVRIFSDETEWSIRNLLDGRTWRVDRATACVAIAFLAPGNPAKITSLMLTGGPDAQDASQIRKRITALINLGVLIRADSCEGGDILDRWASLGWAEAHDYLLATWDFPFEDYSRGGQETDKQRMREYARHVEDDVRSLPLKGDSSGSISLLSAVEALSSLDTAQDDVGEVGLHQYLLDVAAAAALPIEWRGSRTPGANYLKRTSPSGGCRHPSELYLLVLDVPGLRRGCYHVGITEGQMAFMADLPDDRDLMQGMPGAFRLGAAPRAIFIVATHFDRNMYRYREPRTLRTVYYDAGHFGGLIEALCDSHGLVAHGHQGFGDTFVQKLIQSHSLAHESPTYVVSVGLASEAKEGVVQVGKSRLNA